MFDRNYNPSITKDPSLIKFSLQKNNGSILNNPRLGEDLTIHPLIKNGLATGINIRAVNLGTSTAPAYKSSMHIFGDIDEDGHNNRITAKYESEEYNDSELLEIINETLNHWHNLIRSVKQYVEENLFYFVNDAQTVSEVNENIINYTNISCNLMFEEFLSNSGNLGTSSGAIAPINPDPNDTILNSASTNNPIVKNTKLPITYGKFKELTMKQHLK